MRVWPEWKDQDDLVKRLLFKDIFTINLNHRIEIVIIPEFQLDNNGLVLQEELNLDEVFSENDAKFSKVFFTDYVITISKEKAGQEEKVNMGSLVKGLSEEFVPAFFYISPEEFNTLNEELEELGSETGLHRFLDMDKVKGSVTYTLIEKVINSSFFDFKDVEWIKSGNGAWV